jgi:hypothetical protein
LRLSKLGGRFLYLNWRLRILWFLYLDWRLRIL